MGSADERSAQIVRPDGVALSLQVLLYKVEPSKASTVRNLLAKNDERAPDSDQVVERRP